MEREKAIADLPPALAEILRMRDAGLTADEIAADLGIEPEGVPTLLELAEAKLARALAREEAAP
jgi:DNA-directed RNA polymerase specialized sigma24 family protein